MFSDERSREDAASVAHEEFEKGILPRRELNRSARTDHLPRCGIERQIGNRQGRRARRRAAPQQRTYPGKELCKLERLREVIVRPDVEARHLVRECRARSEHEDGHTTTLSPEFAYDVEAVPSG